MHLGGRWGGVGGSERGREVRRRKEGRKGQKCKIFVVPTSLLIWNVLGIICPKTGLLTLIKSYSCSP